MNKTFSVTVGIPAYNEEFNIANLLNSLLVQKSKTFTLNKILVYSDGSSDKTCEIVTNLGKKHPVITLIKGYQRKGKYFRINQMFRAAKSDILIILDADIAMVGQHFIEKLISKLISDPKAQMISAHNVLLRPKTFIGKVIYAELMIWEFVRLSIPNYDSALNFFGSATAYRGSFARTTSIPTNLKDPHLYIYLAARKVNGFRYCRSAKVLQWSISTLEDLKKLLRRSIGKKDKKLEKIFRVNMDQLFYVPWNLKLKGFLQALMTQPFYTFLAIFLNIYVTKIYHHQNVNKTPVWEILSSTKKPITYEK